MFRWNPITLQCQVYENEVPVDLDQCSDETLEVLADAIEKLWKMPKDSALKFEVEIYEKHYWMKQPQNFIEIASYVETPYRKKQISVSKLYIEKMVGNRMKITPEHTVFRKWSDDVEVMFVV